MSLERNVQARTGSLRGHVVVLYLYKDDNEHKSIAAAAHACEREGRCL